MNLFSILFLKIIKLRKNINLDNPIMNSSHNANFYSIERKIVEKKSKYDNYLQNLDINLDYIGYKLITFQ